VKCTARQSTSAREQRPREREETADRHEGDNPMRDDESCEFLEHACLAQSGGR
jgi:hypothetical protein